MYLLSGDYLSWRHLNTGDIITEGGCTVHLDMRELRVLQAAGLKARVKALEEDHQLDVDTIDFLYTALDSGGKERAQLQKKVKDLQGELEDARAEIRKGDLARVEEFKQGLAVGGARMMERLQRSQG